MINLLEVFGVEEGEEFEIELGYVILKHKILNNTLLFYMHGKWSESELKLNKIKNINIRRLPFVPKQFDKYYTPNIRLEVINVEFYTNTADLFRLEYGLCYRTKEQTEREGIPKMKALIEKWGGKVE